MTVTDPDSPAVAYWNHVDSDDLSGAMQHVVSLLEEGWTVTQVVEDLISPTQRRVGDLWARDAWSVSREHAATALNEAVVRRVGAIRRSAQAHRDAPEVVVVCAESEWHGLPALTVTAVLNDNDVPAVFLGADVRVAAVHQEVVRLNTRAVVVSASLASSLPFVRRLVEVVRAAQVPIVVGGSAFDPDGLRAAALGATAHANRSVDLPEVVRQLPTRVSALERRATAATLEADQLTPRRRELVGAVMAQLHGGRAEPWRDFVAQQMPQVVGALEAALLVNDPGIVCDAWSWLEETLEHRGSAETVARVRDAVAHVVREFPAATRLLREADEADGARSA